MNTVNSEYQIFEKDYLVKYQAVLEDLKITVGLFGLAQAPWPDTNALMSESATMAEIAKIRTQGQKISLGLYVAADNGPWQYESEVVLQNQGGSETHVPILVPFLSSNETLLVGGNFKLGVRVEPKWNQPLKANDYLIIKGTWRQVVSFSKKKDDDVDALAARIAAIELALEGRLINLPDNTVLGRNEGVGTVQVLAKAALLENNCLLSPRSGSTPFNANTWLPASFAAVLWLDNNSGHLNLPATITFGVLLQFDPLFKTNLTGKYRIQTFNTGNRYWDRGEFNSAWGNWQERAYRQ
ncbi:hypothetical protein QT974_08685 [Microcoleus sp. herbarium12]